jgi:O-acetyl-ADP-ribose deacetylase (regulator of RNase III)
MIELRTGDILNADVEALVNTVNCVGIMGRGIALQFKNAFPENFEAYAAACAHDRVQPGTMFVYETGQLTNPRYIINFPTKRHWRGKSRIQDIESGLAALVHEVRSRSIRSIAVPPLGSGLGGLQWSEVRPLIISAFEVLPHVKVEVFEPRGAPDAAVMARAREVPRMTSGRAALVVLARRYLNGLLDPFVSLLELHKLLYFMQAAGQALNLSYKKAAYGPYAEKLRHVLKAVEGHYLSGYADGGDAPNKRLQVVPGAVAEAEAFLVHDKETFTRFERVADLVEGFETPFGLELLATVHWVAAYEGAATADEAVERVYAWSARKSQFSPRQIAVAFNVLQQKGWISSPDAASVV